MKEWKDFEEESVNRRSFMKISGFSALALATGSVTRSSLAYAKDPFPTGKITYIVPNRVGGGHDVYARAISPYLAKYLKEASGAKQDVNIVVRNEPAAGGLKGFGMIFKAKPDGYTIGAIDTSAITDSFLETAGGEFDYTKFTFILFAVSTTRMIITSKNGPSNWKEVMNAMKKEPVKAATGTFGNTNQVVAIYMNEKMGTRFKPVVFPGSPESLNALIRGDVPVAFVSQDSAAALIKAGEVRPLLVFGDAGKYPGALSVKEAGYPDIGVEMATNRFIIAPPGLEAEPKRILLSALKKATTDPAFVAWAKNADFHLTNTYGDEADKMFKRLSKFFYDFAPVLKKNLT